jgi:RNA polymerase sigma-70 factor (ECF subfamily)
MGNHSDEALARMAREGDRHAFERLFERYKKPILNFVYRLIGNRETAEEVTQETFIRVYRNLDIFDPNRKFSSWVYTIARNLAKNALRDRKYFRDVSYEKPIAEEGGTSRLKDVLADPHAGPDIIAQDKELNRQAQEVLQMLPLKSREIITLCCIQGLTYKEAADILGCSVATIAFRLQKAKTLFLRKLGIGAGGKKE